MIPKILRISFIHCLIFIFTSAPVLTTEVVPEDLLLGDQPEPLPTSRYALYERVIKELDLFVEAGETVAFGFNDIDYCFDFGTKTLKAFKNNGREIRHTNPDVENLEKLMRVWAEEIEKCSLKYSQLRLRIFNQELMDYIRQYHLIPGEASLTSALMVQAAFHQTQEEGVAVFALATSYEIEMISARAEARSAREMIPQTLEECALYAFRKRIDDLRDKKFPAFLIELPLSPHMVFDLFSYQDLWNHERVLRHDHFRSFFYKPGEFNRFYCTKLREYAVSLDAFLKRFPATRSPESRKRKPSAIAKKYTRKSKRARSLEAEDTVGHGALDMLATLASLD